MYLKKILILFSVLIFVSCQDEKPTLKTTEFSLSEFELKNGIGPIAEPLQIEVTIDTSLSDKGKTIFDTKCASCHKLDERYTGPAQRNVVERRSLEYIMNMTLNPEEMLKKHPEAKKMLAEYLTQMPNQNLTFDDARAVLEFLREANNLKK